MPSFGRCSCTSGCGTHWHKRMVILCEMSPLPLGWWRHSTRTGGFTLRWKKHAGWAWACTWPLLCKQIKPLYWLAAQKQHKNTEIAADAVAWACTDACKQWVWPCQSLRNCTDCVTRCDPGKLLGVLWMLPGRCSVLAQTLQLGASLTLYASGSFGSSCSDGLRSAESMKLRAF